MALPIILVKDLPEDIKRSTPRIITTPATGDRT